MADTIVSVESIDKDAFANALSSVPAWASEKTAGRIEALLKQSLKIQTKLLSEFVTSAGSNPVELEGLDDLNDEIKKLLKNVDNQNKTFPKLKKFWDDEEKNYRRKQRDSKEEVGRFAKLASVVGLLGKVGTTVKDTFKQNIETFDRLTNAGVSVTSGFDNAESGFDALKKLSQTTGVRFTELAASLERYSTSVNSVGLGKFAKTIESSRAEMAGFGFSAKESADVLGAYLDSQRGFVSTQNRTQASLNKDLVNFGNRIRSLSILTGQSTTAIMDNIVAISKSTDIAVLAGQIGADGAQKTSEFIASFSNKNVGAALLKMMTAVFKPLNSTFQEFQRIGLGAFGNKLMNFMQSIKGLDPAQQRKMMAEFVKNNENEMQWALQQAQRFSEAGVAEGHAVKETITGLLQSKNEVKEEDPADKAKREETQKASTNLRNEQERWEAQLQMTLAPTIGMVNTLTSVIKGVNDSLDGLRSGIDSFAEFLKNKGFTDAKVDLISMAGAGAMVVGALVAVAAALKSAATYIGWLFSKNKEGIDVDNNSRSGRGRTRRPRGDTDRRGTPRGAAGNQANGPLSGLAKNIADIGKGIGAGLGNLVGNFLEGLARGLTALGTKQVLLGTASLIGIASSMYIAGAAIQQFVSVGWEDLAKAGTALVGMVAGLALVGKVLGKAAPQLLIGAFGLGVLGAALWVTGEAVQKFVNVSWEDLAKAGTALVGLGAAGAAAGAVSPLLIAGAAGLLALSVGVYGITKALKSFMTIKDSDLKIAINTLKDLGKTSATLGMYAPAMLAAAAGMAALSIPLGILAGVAYIAAPGLKSLSESISLFNNVNGSNLESTAKGIVALSGALLAFSASGLVSSIGSILSSIASGISSFFGGSTILVQLQEFAKLGPGLQQAVSAMTVLGSSLKTVTEFLNLLSSTGPNLQSSISSFLPTIKAMVNAFSPLVSSIDPIKSSMTSLATSLTVLSFAFGSAGNNMLKTQTQFITASSLISAVTTSISTAFKSLTDNIGSVTSQISAVTTSISTAFKSLIDSINPAALQITTVTTAISSAFKSLIDSLGAVSSSISSISSSISTAFSGLIDNMAPVVVQLYSMIRHLSSGFGVLSLLLEITTESVVSSSNKILTTLVMSISSIGAYKTTVGLLLNQLVSVLTSIVSSNTLLAEFLATLGQSLDKSTNSILAFGDTMKKFASNIVVYIPSIFAASGAMTSLANSYNLLTAAGNGKGLDNIVDGIKSISEALSKFTGLSKLKDIVNGVNEVNSEKTGFTGKLKEARSPAFPELKPAPTIDVSKSPKLSKLNSPSIVTTTPSASDSKVNSQKSAPIVAPIVGQTGKNRDSEKIDINTALDYQTILLEQISLSLSEIASLNSEILKYSKVRL